MIPKVAGVWLIVFCSYAILLLDEARITGLGAEDGPIENLGAGLFLIASGLFLAAGWSSRSPGAGIGRIHLALALLFLICGGEELSWGQRIFGWDTPQALERVNVQGETNLHNLRWFHGLNPDGSRKSPVAMLLNTGRLLSLFGLGLCGAVPLLDRLSPRARRMFRRISLPVVPLWIGALFAVHAALFHALFNWTADFSAGVSNALNELKESNYALLFAVLGFVELRRRRASRASAGPRVDGG